VGVGKPLGLYSTTPTGAWYCGTGALARDSLRLRWSMKTAIAIMLRTVQPPIVPPMMGPRLGFESVLGVSVGVLDGVTKDVTVTMEACGIEVGIGP